jgi:hypothetical protein
MQEEEQNPQPIKPSYVSVEDATKMIQLLEESLSEAIEVFSKNVKLSLTNLVKGMCENTVVLLQETAQQNGKPTRSKTKTNPPS